MHLQMNPVAYCACADPLYKGMEQPQSCSSSGGVGLNNSLLRTAHAQIHCINEWSNLKAARAQGEWGKTGGCGYLVISSGRSRLIFAPSRQAWTLTVTTIANCINSYSFLTSSGDRSSGTAVCLVQGFFHLFSSITTLELYNYTVYITVY